MNTETREVRHMTEGERASLNEAAGRELWVPVRNAATNEGRKVEQMTRRERRAQERAQRRR